MDKRKKIDSLSVLPDNGNQFMELPPPKFTMGKSPVFSCKLRGGGIKVMSFQGQIKVMSFQLNKLKSFQLKK